MLPILFTIPKFKLGSYSLGPMPIHSYGVMIVLSFVAAMWLIRKRATRYGFEPEKVVDMGFWALIAGVLGARLGFIVQELPYYLKHQNELFSLQFSGLTSFGGEIAGVVAILIWARRNKFGVVKILDLVGPGYVLGYAVGPDRLLPEWLLLWRRLQSDPALGNQVPRCRRVPPPGPAIRLLYEPCRGGLPRHD